MNDRARGALFAWILTCAGAPPLAAQEVPLMTAIDDLPRPGYEQMTIRAGSFVIKPSFDAALKVDSNILATDVNRLTDVIFQAEPAIEIEQQSPTSKRFARAYGKFWQNSKYTRENTAQFGAALNYRQDIDRRQSVAASLSFDRTFERRGDPEAIFSDSRRPALINVASAELAYKLEGTRIGFSATVGVTKLDYLALEDADRDMVTYRIAVRGKYRLTRRVAVFVQPFVNQRVPRLLLDRNGINRKTTTYGVVTGVALELASKLTGEIGIGVFRADPKDLGLEDFTGVAASGQLTWRPRIRTALEFSVFRGDVATFRAGAFGRIDTRVGIGIDQEARHNLILRANASYRSIHYRGAFNQDQTYWSGEASARYLMNRNFWIEATGVYTTRSTTDGLNEFGKWQGLIRITFKI